MIRTPPLIEGEKIIKRATACIFVGLRSNSWKPINLILTNRRLLFCQPLPRVIFGVALDKIKDMLIVKRRIIFGLKRKTICIVIGNRHRYVAIDNPEIWRDDIILAKNFR